MNPAAAQVERIVRECARNAYAMTQNFAPGCSIECREELAPIIHRAVADAIAALQVREAVALVRGPLDGFVHGDNEIHPAQLNAMLVWCDQALANLDAVCGKE